MFRPQFLTNAVFLVKQEETKSFKPIYTSVNTTSSYKYTSTNSRKTELSPIFSSTPSLKPTTKDVISPKSILSSKEIMKRRAKGLCFHCDEKYHPGLDCKAKLYQLEGEECEDSNEPEVVGVVYDMDNLLTTEETPCEISLKKHWLIILPCLPSGFKDC